MRRFLQQRIGARLALGFGLMAVALVLVVLTASRGLTQVGEQIDLVNEDRYPKVQMITEVERLLNQQARSARNLLLMNNAQALDREQRTIAETRERISTLYRQLEGMLSSERGKALFAELQQRRSDYVAQLDPFLAQVRAGDQEAARERLLTTLRDRQLDYMKTLAAFASYKRN